MSKPKVALVHEYLVQYGGAEKTMEEIMDLFPDAPIYTGIYNPRLQSVRIRDRKIVSPTGSFFSKFSKYFTFLMPFIFENFDLRNFDIIISDGTAWPKGILSTPEQLHISYIHTPPRFLYKYSVESAKRNIWFFKPFVTVIDFLLRIWDFNAAQRPNYLLVNSEETRKRVKKFYGRDARVIYPPVEVDYQIRASEKDNLKSSYYLALGRLSAYKNFDILIQAFNLLELPLVVIGTGIEEKKLKKLARENITFVGKVSDTEKHQYLEGCLGVVNPVVEEDFGIVPVEAMGHGKPVLAHRSGGALETIKEGINGRFFEKVTIEDLADSIREFDQEVRSGKYRAEEIKDTARRFSKERFREEIKKFIEAKWEEHAGITGSSYNITGSE